MIGIFDSGIGGLSVAKAIRELAPSADLLYFGDTINAPYGNKETEELEILTLRAMKFLKNNGADFLVSACNSISAEVILPILELFDVTSDKLVEMVGPTSEYLSEFKNNRIAVVATPATVRSASYQKGCAKYGLKPCMVSAELLAGQIEAGVSVEKIKKSIIRVAKEIIFLRSELLVLGCTHYSFVKEVFEDTFEQLNYKIKILDPAKVVARAAIDKAGIKGDGKLLVFVSKNTKEFNTRCLENLACLPSGMEQKPRARKFSFSTFI